MSGDSSVLTIDTPSSIVQCQNTTITWNGGVEPFYVGYIASGTVGGTSTASPAVAFRTAAHSQDWLCNVAAGVDITLTVRDSGGTIAYSSPLEVGNSSDITCLPGYVAPSASTSPTGRSLSKGAIGGIAAGAAAGAIIIAVIVFFLLRARRRRRRHDLSSLSGDSVGSEKTREGEEPKVEPYVGRGEVDLADRHEQTLSSPSQMGSTTAVGDSNTGSASPVGELEREVKQMLGVQPSSSGIHSGDGQARSNSTANGVLSPIPTKSSLQPSQRRADLSPSNPTSRPSPTSATRQDQASGPAVHDSRTPSEQPDGTGADSGEIEYVRHTDGGGMRVELPPLYTDVPRNEVENAERRT